MTVSAIPPAVVADAAAAARGWLRAADGTEDATIATLVQSAIVLAEAWCGQLFVSRDASDAVAADGTWQPLPTQPATAIVSVQALATDGTTSALAASDFAIDLDATGTGWVRSTRPLDVARLLVGYRAGLAATWDAFPPPVAQGVAMMVAHLFDQREGDAPPPPAVAALWRPWRRVRLAASACRR